MTTFDRAVEAARNAQKYHAICGGLGGNVYAAVTTGTRFEFIARFEDATIAFNHADRLTTRAALLAALKELREPSEAMLQAAYAKYGDSRPFNEQFVAAIDALIKEAENG